MIKTLSIQNAALIDSAEFSFTEGLNVLSGETGAGKSVILECIDFVLGAKADASLIRYGQTECVIRAEFYAPDAAVQDMLEEMDFERDDTVIISRKFNREGKGSIRLNGCAISLAMLRRLTSLLVDVHGQSEHFFLLKESNQLILLDRLAGVSPEKEQLKELLIKKRELLSSLSLLGGDEGERSRRMDILRYQIDEIKRGELKAEEEEQLLALRLKYNNQEKITYGLSTVCDALCNEKCAIDCINAARRALNGISRYGDYSELLTRLDSIVEELDDISDEARDQLYDISYNILEHERVENRLDEIKALKHKYGGSVENVLEFLEKAEKELTLLGDSKERIEQINEELKLLNESIFASCNALTKKRERAAKDFTKRVVEELKTLNISSADFKIRFETYSSGDVENATANGLDKVSYLFSANAGEPLKELSKIISGGEMSRFMLAVKTVLNSNAVGSYVFDEIDAGIGGRTAWVIGEKFATIAKGTQVIAVSHLAQIAVFADAEFLIEKTECGEKTFTRVKEVTGEEKVKEIARLIAGDTSELSLKQATELMEKAKKVKEAL